NNYYDIISMSYLFLSCTEILLNPYSGLDVKTNTKVTVLGLSYRTKW
ncbi:hypothetical protein, partial [Acinetobacter baumannii]